MSIPDRVILAASLHAYAAAARRQHQAQPGHSAAVSITAGVGGGVATWRVVPPCSLARCWASLTRASPSLCCCNLLNRNPAVRRVAVASLASTAREVSTICPLPSSRTNIRPPRAPIALFAWCCSTRCGATAARHEGVGVQIEEAGFLDQAAGFDQSPSTGLAPGVLELGFLFGKLGCLLFMSTKALSKTNEPLNPSPTASEDLKADRCSR
jgi:hypothetical protein